jgi:hypothetical protein
MEKIFKILAVFGLLMLAITYSMYARERRFREYFFSRRLSPLLPWDPGNEPLSVQVIREGEEGTAEAEDREDRLAFHPGPPGEKRLSVSDWQTGDPIAEIPLEESSDAIIFDAAARLIYSYSNEGALTIIRQTNRSVYKVVQRLLLPRNGDTLAVDPKKGRIYLSAGGEVYVYTNE